MTYLKVKDHPGLVRDPKSKAIINIDKDAYSDYQNKKIIQSKMINMNEEIYQLKQSVEEIKQLITQLAQRL